MLVEIGRTIPEFPFTVVAATKSFAASSPNKVASILRALDKANRLIQNDKEAAVQLEKPTACAEIPRFSERRSTT